MFLHLPAELREDIYDRLHIKDKTKLNMALPRQCRISKTIKTNPQRDMQIKMSYYFFKKRKDKLSFSSNIFQFINNNTDDTTCKEILQDLLPNGSFENNELKSSMILHQIEQEFSENIVTIEVFEQIGSDHDIVKLREIIIHAKNISLDSLQKLIDNPSSLNILKRVFSEYCILFTLVNHSNEKLLKYVVDNRDVLGVRDNQFEYICQKNIATIFERKNEIELMLKYIHIPYDVQQVWLEKAIERFDTKLADWLMTDLGIML